jgi:predicted DNA-binding protein (UPF0278 family)
VLDVP